MGGGLGHDFGPSQRVFLARATLCSCMGIRAWQALLGPRFRVAVLRLYLKDHGT